MEIQGRDYGAGGGGGGGGLWSVGRGGYPWELTIFSCGNLYALFFLTKHITNIIISTLSCAHTGKGHNFNVYDDAGQLDSADGLYDFRSLMHYGNFAFSKNNKPTMVVIKDPSLQLGRNGNLSYLDIIQLNILYNCKCKFIKLDRGLLVRD